jgi:WD40 repeat protein
VPIRPSLLLLAVLLLGACRSGTPPYVRGLSVASTTPPSSLLRLPVRGGTAELYHVPRLEPWGWRATDPMPALERVVGADLDLGLVYLLDTKHDIVTLDLQTARPRPQAITSVRDVTVGPDGTLFTVDDSLRVVQIVHRNPVRVASRLPARPLVLFGTRGPALLALSRGASNVLSVLHATDPAGRILVPGGDASATFWGDLVAIAADTAVVLIDPDRPDSPVALPLRGHVRAVAFSPSGHRFYVALKDRELLVFNRFTRERLDKIDLPGSAGGLRLDPYGRWLLVRHPTADSVWLVDLADNRYLRGFAAEWDADLPTITNQRTLLVKSGKDVVAYDLTHRDFAESGRVAGGAADFWLPLAWTPETGTATAAGALPAEPDTTTAASEATAVFLQVSSSQNRDWSQELARQLSQQGLPAKVLDPRPGEDGFRVVLGPYPSREAAESTGRGLGRPFFVYQPNR